MLVSSGNLEQKMCLKQRSFYGQNIIVNFAFFYKTWLCSDGSNLFKLLGVNFLSNNFFFFHNHWNDFVCINSFMY